jgi:hypothetical protein
MKTYKLWVDIEEHDLENDERRSLVDFGEALPVPIAEFSDFHAAVQFAESLSLDQLLEGLGEQPITN